MTELFLNKKIGFAHMKKLVDLAESIEEHKEYEIENLIKTVLIKGRLQLYLFIEGHGWVYNCTLTKPSRKLTYSD